MRLPEELFFNEEQSYQDLELKFSKKIIKMRKYLVQEVRKYLNAVSTTDSEWNRNSETFKLFKACVHPSDHPIVDSMCKADFVFALSCLRSISHDPTIYRPHACPNCNWAFPEYRIPVVAKTVYDPENFEMTFEYTTVSGDKIVFKQLPYIKELDIIKNTDETNYYATIENILFNSVDKLVINNAVYDDMPLEDIIKFFNKNVDPDDYPKIMAVFSDKKVIFWLEDKRTCPNCKVEYPITVDEPHFFVNA